MALIIEVLDHRGVVVSYHRCSEASVTIGRSYENDLVLQDEAVDAFHALLNPKEDGGYQIVDRESLNGISLAAKKAAKAVSLDVTFGDEINIGRSRLRLVDSHAAVSKATALTPESTHWLQSNWVLALLGLSVLFLALFDSYQAAVVELKASDYFVALLEETVAWAVLLFALGVLSRIAKKHWNLKANLLVLCLLEVGLFLLSLIIDVFQFNFGRIFSSDIENIIQIAGYAIAIVWLITNNLAIKKVWMRMAWIFGIATFAGVYSMAQDWANEFESSKFRPPINRIYSSVVLPGVPVISDEQFIQQSASLFHSMDASE